MNKDEFLEQLHRFNKKVEDFYYPYKVNEREPLYDGPLNSEEYFQSNTKIVWLLKEAYEEEDGTGGGWDYSKNIGENSAVYILKRPYKTWRPIAYINYGIFNGFKRWDDIPDVDWNNIHEFSKEMKKTAVVNISKLPALGYSSTDNKEIQRYFEKNRDLILEQLQILNPDIIVCGGTGDWLKQLFNINEIGHSKVINIDSIKDTLCVFAYHPSYSSRKGFVKEYTNEIIKSVEAFIRSNT